jgi:hypothetical protein
MTALPAVAHAEASGQTAREMFILSQGGAEVTSYSSAGQAMLLPAIVPAYSAFASRVNRTQLVQWVTLFFAGNLGLFLIALGFGLHIGMVFFRWLGIFNVVVIAQLWAFAADCACGWLGVALGLRRNRLHARAHESGRAEL